MPHSVISRSIRILKPLSRYKQVHGSNIIDPYTHLGVLHPDEVIIGVYDNSEEGSADVTLVTDQGIHVFMNQAWSYFDYGNIVDVATPTDKAAEGLNIRLKSGDTFWLPVRGTKGRFRDTFEFLRFLDRVVEDVRKKLYD